jgi:hypothetical protein
VTNAFKILVEKNEGKRNGVDGRKNIKMDLRVGGCGLDSSRSGQGPVSGSCEHGN